MTGARCCVDPDRPTGGAGVTRVTRVAEVTFENLVTIEPTLGASYGKAGTQQGRHPALG